MVLLFTLKVYGAGDRFGCGIFINTLDLSTIFIWNCAAQVVDKKQHTQISVKAAVKTFLNVSIVSSPFLPPPRCWAGNRLFCFDVLDLIKCGQRDIYRNALRIIKFMTLSHIVFTVQNTFDSMTPGGGCPFAWAKSRTCAISLMAIRLNILRWQPISLFLIIEYTVNINPV